MLVLENLSFDRGENRGLGALVVLLESQGDKNSGLLTLVPILFAKKL